MRLPNFPRSRRPNSIMGDRPSETGGPGQAKLERLCRGCRRDRKGAAAVEFALVAPLFFMLIVGMLEFGRAMMVQQIITNASREGARSAVLDGSTATAVKNSINSYLSGVGIAGATTTITPTEPATAGYGEPVTVKVDIPFGKVSWVPLPKIPFTKIDLKSKTLSASTVMRRETVQ